MTACNSDDPSPTAPTNHSPVIRSLRCFPATIGPGDSAIAICDAFDPEGDPLFFDWVSDGKLRLAGAPPGEAHVLTSLHSSQVVYYGTPISPSDTAFVQCIAYDDHGGSSGAIVKLPLHP